METIELLERLGYVDAPNFVSQERGDFNNVVDYGHVFRHASGEPCSLKGVYALRESQSVLIPVVYVCQASSETQADDIHKLVWNQNVVPFLIVNAPESVRLYAGFRYRHGKHAKARGRLAVLEDFNSAAKVAEFIDPFHAEAVDAGQTWRQWGSAVTPEHRVDWQLLKSLKKLGRWLGETGGLDPHVSHALIGKYVYLHYLRDRGILSPGKLANWGIPKEEVFGRDATVDGLKAVVAELDNWLNGDVFPMDFDTSNAPGIEQIRRVAGTFEGDEPREGGDWQLHLDFPAYDFSYIPIETLSIVYEQFLHTPRKGQAKSSGRSAGAYYTPIPVVNFMLSELEERRPLQRGMRVLDPACGSGAYLVQCYRRLIEKQFPPGASTAPTVGELRDLLERHIFGVDTDPDACSVTELSLALTLLDYVDPPDLENGAPGPKPELPSLRGTNIFCDNFFHEDTPWQRRFVRRKFDWVVGNPPWKQLNPKDLSDNDEPVWGWMKENKAERPVGSNQTARAFAWRAADYLTQDGEIAMFLPAMTLFENPATAFRKKFLQAMQVHTVANFANLAEVISAGRFRVPAAAFFYTPRHGQARELDEGECVRTYSPLVANQEPTRPLTEGKRTETWSIVINASEVRDVPYEQVIDGSGLPWKLASWGSQLDARLVRSLQKRFDSVKKLEREGRLVVAEGPQLRETEVEAGAERTKRVEALVGRKVLDMSALEGMRHFFVFPEEALKRNNKLFLRLRGGERGLAVCCSPHVLVGEARMFAVYADEFVVVPPRQIGIASPAQDRDFLKALSLFLSSDFALYHQFLTSPAFGVKRDVATLGALRQMPVPLARLSRGELTVWVDLHARLVQATASVFDARRKVKAPLYEDGSSRLRLDAGLLRELNSLVYDSLGMNREDRVLVSDLVHVRLELIDGKLGEPAVRVPTKAQIRSYAACLRSELDVFVGPEGGRRHQVHVVYDDLSAMIRVDLLRHGVPGDVSVAKADSPMAAELVKARERLRKRRSQWVYFDRNLRVYEGTRTFILKPMQRFHWTETQARLDARDIIAETLDGGN